MSRRWLVLVLVLSLLAAPVGSAVVAGSHGHDAGEGSTDGPAGGSTNDQADGSTDDCFAGTDYELLVGETDGVNIHLGLHISLFRNLGSPGIFGVELDGNVGETSVVSLQTGVLFEGITSVAGFFANPLSAFQMVYEYRFSLPMFAEETGNDWTHEEDEPPLSGPFETADC